MRSLTRILSGGQTGVDHAALRAASAAGLHIGGWCPPQRLCESGTIPDDFPLRETPTERSPDAPEVPRSLRTQWNVRDADATLILSPQLARAPDPGTEWTRQCAQHFGRPVLTVDPYDPHAVETITRWIIDSNVTVLNVGGPSESTWPGIGDQVFEVLGRVLG